MGRALPIGGVGGGLGLIVLLVTLFLRGGGVEVGDALEGLGAVPEGAESGPATPDPDRDLVDFLNFVVEDVQASWEQVFTDAGRTYEPTVLVLFDEATPTACGTGSAASGPFYCPADGKMYLDLGFFRELHDRFGAPGDFAQAYVVAHEVGHHVQTLTGVSERVHAMRQRSSERQANQLSVQQELQADCYAGVWGYHAGRRQGLLDPGDAEEGLRAAAAIGDDRLQKQSQGRVVPESFTHGSSDQRVQWLRKGMENGRMEACDTFNAGTF